MVRARNGHERRPERPSLSRPVMQFAASGLAVVVLLGVSAVLVLRHIGRNEAIRDAKVLTALSARAIVQPAVMGSLENRDPGAVAALDGVVRGRLVGGEVVRVKIWDASGRILYSDEHRLIGHRYSLGDDEQDALQSGHVHAELSDLGRPENRFERRYGKLLEVYLPIRGPDGRPLLFEMYERYSSIASGGRRVWLPFLPAMLGALVLLELVQLPLAWRLARRLRSAQQERELLLRRAIEASDVERRRIARDLHDGAVQDLAGVSYTLTAAANARPEEARGAMHEAAAETRRAIKELRTLLVDIYPPDLHRTGLEAALRDLVAPLAPRGIEARLDVSPDLRLRPELEMLFFRCAQEALRNVAAHSRASHVLVSAEVDGGIARLTVKDDGRGFANVADEGHMGLRLLDDVTRDAGGKLEIESSPGAGTRVCVEAPA